MWIEFLNVYLTIHFSIGLFWATVAAYGNLTSKSSYRWDEHVLYFVFTVFLWPALIVSLIRELKHHYRLRRRK